MSEAEFPYELFQHKPFHLRTSLDNGYEDLRRKFEQLKDFYCLEDTEGWTFDRILEDLSEGVPRCMGTAWSFEAWIRSLDMKAPSSFNAYRLAVAFWLDADRAEKAGDESISLSALLAFMFYMGAVYSPWTITEAAFKGGATTSRIYVPLERAAVNVAERLAGEGHLRAHQGASLTTKGIIPFIVKDASVIEANESLGEHKCSDLSTTLTRWARTGKGSRPDFRAAFLKLKEAWKTSRKNGKRKISEVSA